MKARPIVAATPTRSWAGVGELSQAGRDHGLHLWGSDRWIRSPPLCQPARSVSTTKSGLPSVSPYRRSASDPPSGRPSDPLGERGRLHAAEPLEFDFGAVVERAQSGEEIVQWVAVVDLLAPRRRRHEQAGLGSARSR